MTLAAQMVTDFHTVHLNTDEHAESITYTPVGGSPSTYPAIITRGEDVDARIFPDGMFTVPSATLELGYDGTYGPVTVTEHDSVSFDGQTWYVTGRPLKDGRGRQTLRVQREVLSEFGGNRIERK